MKIGNYDTSIASRAHFYFYKQIYRQIRVTAYHPMDRVIFAPLMDMLRRPQQAFSAGANHASR